MRIVMMGSGGLGAFFGGLLARAGQDVTFIARGRNLEALKTCGLTVKLLPGSAAAGAPSTDSTFHLDNVQATDDPAEVGPVDLVWFCVKTYDLDAAAHQARPLVGAETLVLPIQNGVEAPEHLAAVLGMGHVLGGVAQGGATLTAPGVVEQKTARVPLSFGELDGRRTARVERLHRTLVGAGIEATLSEDIVRELWEKLAFASYSQALTALTRLPMGTLLACPETADLARDMIAEAVAVGRAQGVALPDDAVDRLFAHSHRFAQADPTARGSMAFDLEAGRRLELEAIVGVIVRLGRAAGIPTPLHAAMDAALKPFAEGAPALPHGNTVQTSGVATG